MWNLHWCGVVGEPHRATAWAWVKPSSFLGLAFALSFSLAIWYASSILKLRNKLFKEWLSFHQLWIELICCMNLVGLFVFTMRKLLSIRIQRTQDQCLTQFCVGHMDPWPQAVQILRPMKNCEWLHMNDALLTSSLSWLVQQIHVCQLSIS